MILQCIREWCENGCCIRNETSVEVDKSKESTELLHRCRTREITDDLHLLIQWFDTVLINMMSKKVKIVHAEYTLLWIDNNAILG